MNKPCVLVVDDEAPITFVVALKLREVGLDVVTVSNGVDGLQRAREIRPQLVITDHQMPGMSGLELAAQLRGDPETSGIPILMLTARSHKIQPTDQARANIEALIDKPFSPRQLVERVLELLGRPDLTENWNQLSKPRRTAA